MIAGDFAFSCNAAVKMHSWSDVHAVSQLCAELLNLGFRMRRITASLLKSTTTRQLAISRFDAESCMLSESNLRVAEKGCCQVCACVLKLRRDDQRRRIE